MPPSKSTAKPAAGGQGDGPSPVMSDDESGRASATSWHANDSHEPHSADSGRSGDELDDDGTLGSLPMLKRRRVARACDECRRKKIKCDGKRPCTHCSVYSYECTYDKPSNRRRNPAPQYVEALENRLHLAEALLRKYIPDVDLTDPNLDPAIEQEFRKREHARGRGPRPTSLPEPAAEQNDAQLTSMIESIGQLDLDDEGRWDFHGSSSGVVFLGRMREHFGVGLGPKGRAPFLPIRPTADKRPLMVSRESTQSTGSPGDSSSGSMLPPKELARKLCNYSLTYATCLLRFVHRPSFYEHFDQLYKKPHSTYTEDDMTFVALIYAAMALGCMYSHLDRPDTDEVLYRSAIEEGLKYYGTSEYMLPCVQECRDLTSLQALLFRCLFLQATANLSICYVFIGVAQRSAVRMGLHRHLQHSKISRVDQELGRRIFYVIRQLDVYISVLLGLPLLLSEDSFDQVYPTEVDDEYITKEAIRPAPPGTPSFFEAFNAHTRLMEILAKVAKYVYPMRGLSQSVMKEDKPNTTYRISHARIKEIEAELHEWGEKLPQAWRPSVEGPAEVVRVRHLLRFTYAHVQLVLYRPFLHYLSPRLTQGKIVDELSYACAAAGVSVSRNIVHIGYEIRKQGVLGGPYWFLLYTEFFAIISLVFYATENPNNPGSADVLADARSAKQNISRLARKSLSADRITNALNSLFDQLPADADKARARQPSKKRPAAVAKVPSHAQQTPQAGLKHRRSEDVRAQAARPTKPPFPRDPTRRSTDGLHAHEGPNPDAFGVSLHDFMPLDLPSRATPDSSSTHASSQGHVDLTGQQGGMNPLHKLSSIMFPSEDPFQYPNQPMMELGFQQKGHGAEGMLGGEHQHHHDASQLFMSNPLDELGSQLLGQVPTTDVMAHHGTHSLNMAGQMYYPGGVLGMQQGQFAGQPVQGQHVRRQQGQQQQQQVPQQHQHQQGGRGQGDVFFDQYPPDWGSLFANSGFQGL